MRALATGSAILAFGFTAASRAADADAAVAVVAGLYQALVDAAAAEPPLDTTARIERLRPVVISAFDLPEMGRTAAGRHWRDWTDAERARYLDAFERLSVAQHASNFASLSPDVFQVNGSEPYGDSDQIEVNVVIRRSNGEEDVSLDYRLKPDGDQWRIVNVVRMGISSEISALRSDYHAILTDGDLGDLLETLEAQIAACNAGDCYDR